MSEVTAYKYDLVARSANYHGLDLLKLVFGHNKEHIKCMNLQEIDYKIFKERCDIIRRNKSRAQEMIQFIASKSEMLFILDQMYLKIDSYNPNYKDVYENQFPLEYFLQTDRELRCSNFCKTTKRGNILNTMVFCHEEKDYKLRIISCDNGGHRYLNDFQPLSVQVIMKRADTTVDRLHTDNMQNWIIGTRLRVEVLSVDLTGVVYVGTRGVTIDGDKSDIKLGKILIAELPAVFTSNMFPAHKYLSDSVERLNVCKNPKGIEQLAEQFSINLTDYPTLMSSVRPYIPKEEKAPALRQAQLSKWAHKHVADGVYQFKNGNHSLAFQCIEKALKIDPENEEAFVANGALLANLSHYEKAIDEFHKALHINPGHENANKYMCETLVELGRQHKEDEKIEEAADCFNRCIEIDFNHATARECLADLARDTGNLDLLTVLQPDLTTTVKNDAFSEIADMEKEYMQKKEDDMEKSRLVAQMAQPVIEPQLSPLSRKMNAMMDTQLWQPTPNPPPVFNNTPAPYQEHSSYFMPPVHSTGEFFGQLFQRNEPPRHEKNSYEQKVDDFLKRLETRPPSCTDENIDESRRKRSSKESSRSRRRYSSSSSSSTSSSSSSSSGSRRRRMHKRRKISPRRHDSRSRRRRNKSKKKDEKSKKHRSRKSTSSSSSDSSRSKSRKRKSSKTASKDKAKKEEKFETELPSFKGRSRIKTSNPKNQGADLKDGVDQKNIHGHRSRKSTSSSSSDSSRSNSRKRKSSKTAPKDKAKKEENCVAIPEFDDLERKLEAYYKKMVEFKSSSNSPTVAKTTSKPKTSKGNLSPVKQSSPPTKKSVDVNKGPGGIRVHPVFMQPSASSESDESKPSGQKSLMNLKGIMNTNKILAQVAEKKSECISNAFIQENKKFSPKYGYYRNKPYYSSGRKYPNFGSDNKSTNDLKNDDSQSRVADRNLPMNEKKTQVSERAKQQVQKHIKTTDTDKSNFRFGKWADNPEKSSSASKKSVDMFETPSNGGVNIKKKMTPKESLADCEKFLQKAREKRIESMKERNIKFVKSNIQE